MNSEIIYRSLGVNLFNSWKVVFFTWPIILFLGFKIWLLLLLIIFLIQSMFKFTTITRNDQHLEFSDLRKTIIIDNLGKVQTWWNYDFGSSSPDITDGGQGKSRASANKINIYAEFESASKNETVVIFEQIFISSKFPNNHQYNIEKDVDQKKLFKVWDLDNCLSKLMINKD